MNAKWIIIVIVSYLYAFFEIFMSVRQRRKGIIAQSGDKGSIWLLFALITIGYMLSLGIAVTTIGRIEFGNTFFLVGALLIIIGLGDIVNSCVKEIKQQAVT